MGTHGFVGPQMDHDEWVTRLLKRFKLIGVCSIILSPIICIVYIIYVVLRYGAQIEDNPGSLLSNRKWSPLSQWTLRELNEAQHLFEIRMRRAHYHAREYVEQFPTNSTVVIVARSFILIVGVLLFILCIMSFMSGQFIFKLVRFHQCSI